MPISLNDINTDAGCLQYVFLAETLTPEYTTQYNAAEAKRGFEAMCATIFNRLEMPGDFGAPGATNIRQIVTAPGQFAGFSKDAQGNVVITQDIATRIKDILSYANSTTHPRKALHKQFVENAITISASARKDEFEKITKIAGVKVVGRVYGWNKGATMGPRFVKISIDATDQFGNVHNGVILGNQFWTLKAPGLFQKMLWLFSRR